MLGYLVAVCEGLYGTHDNNMGVKGLQVQYHSNKVRFSHYGRVEVHFCANTWLRGDTPTTLRPMTYPVSVCFTSEGEEKMAFRRAPKMTVEKCKVDRAEEGVIIWQHTQVSTES